MTFAAWTEIMVSTMIVIIKVIYKMILVYSFDGDN